MDDQKYYLVTICFDTNDADYIYGFSIIPEKVAKYISNNSEELCGYLDVERPFNEVFDLKEITIEELRTFAQLDMVEFGLPLYYLLDEELLDSMGQFNFIDSLKDKSIL